MKHNEYSRQEAYDAARHHIGQAEHATINMANHTDWQLYNQRRRAAHMHLCQSIVAVRELWQHDNVIMGAWFGVRADWMADALDDLRRIAKLVDKEPGLISDNRNGVRAQQRDGMHNAWTRVRGTMSKVSTAHAKNA